jgi:hypothetical protein
MGCTRPDLPPITWQIRRRALLTRPKANPINCSIYFGRYPDPALEGTEDLIKVHPEYPHEPTADGCPGGWYRTAYMDSVFPYLRRRTTAGGRVDNPRFTGAGWQVQAAVMYFEHEEERWHAYRDKRTHQRWNDTRKKKKGGHGTRR